MISIEELTTMNDAPPAKDVDFEGPVFDLTFDDGSILKYAPHQSLLVDETMTPVSLERLNLGYAPSAHEEIFAISPETPGTKGPVRRLKISMGFKCNYSCSYCSQAFHRYVDKTRKPGDIENFIKKVEAVIPLADGGRGVRIEFWGGEPFVYWHVLKPLAEGLREKYPHADFMTVTNGSLLDEEKVGWLDRMRFGVGVSHDGPGYHFRGKDPLDDPEKRKWIRELFVRLMPKNRVNFNCVLSVPNPSLKAIIDVLEEKIGLTGIALSSEGVTSQYEPAIASLVPQDMGQMRELWRQIFQDACDPKVIQQSPTVKEAMRDFFLSLSRGRGANHIGQKCGMDRPDHLAVDLDGNATTCQNVSANAEHGIGKMDDLAGIRLNTAKHWSNHANCRNCAVVQMCKGSCMYMDGLTRKPVCDGHFTFFFGLFAASLFVLTGKRLVKVEGQRVRLEGHERLEF